MAWLTFAPCLFHAGLKMRGLSTPAWLPTRGRNTSYCAKGAPIAAPSSSAIQIGTLRKPGTRRALQTWSMSFQNEDMDDPSTPNKHVKNRNGQLFTRYDRFGGCSDCSRTRRQGLAGWTLEDRNRKTTSAGHTPSSPSGSQCEASQRERFCLMHCPENYWWGAGGGERGKKRLQPSLHPYCHPADFLFQAASSVPKRRRKQIQEVQEVFRQVTSPDASEGFMGSLFGPAKSKEEKKEEDKRRENARENESKVYAGRPLRCVDGVGEREKEKGNPLKDRGKPI